MEALRNIVDERDARIRELTKENACLKTELTKLRGNCLSQTLQAPLE